MTNDKIAFWHAFVITLFIFLIGIFIGILLENWRSNQISNLYQQSELDLLDIKLQSEIYTFGEFDCKDAIEKNIDFADKIFEEAEIIGRYEYASKLTDNIRIQHKKYDLLRTNLLLNSIKIKEKCKNNYNEVVYFYKYNDPSINTKAKQEAFSKILEKIKDEKGHDLLLIPIAGDNNIIAVNLLLKNYDIKELPTILINRKIKVTDIKTAEEISSYFK
ncbi:MAG: hypothetical protein AABW83_04140 [Nanoarchaeota archaeon]